MPLPDTDPSLISAPAPIFQDNSFVRGDHLRANNQAIWNNLAHLLNGDAAENFSTLGLTVNGLLTAKAKASIEAAFKLTSSNVEGAVILTDADGSVKTMSNVHESAGTIILGFTGATGTQYATRIRQEGSTGIIYFEYYTGTAGATIADNAWTILNRLGVTNPWVPKGSLGAGLQFQSSTLPPTVLAGDRDCGGIGYNLAADLNLTMSNAILGASTTLSDHAYSWLWVTQKINDGSFGILPVVDGAAINSGVSCSGATISSGTATISCGGTLPAVGTVAVILGGNVPIFGKVVTSGAGQFTIKTSSVGTVTGTLTYNNYYRIFTAQNGFGAVNNDALVEVYTPNPGYCQALQQYCLDINGLPTTTAANAVYRILGPWYCHTGPLVEYVYSYKSGRDKNDNYAFLHGVTSCGVVNNKIPIYNTILYLHGTDYTYGTSADSGASFTINSDRPFSANMAQALTTSAYVGISLNSTNLTTAISSLTPPEAISCVNTAGTTIHGTPGFTNKILKKDSVIRPHLYSNAVSNVFLNSFELSSIS